MDELDYVEIGKRIQNRRKEMALTQEKLSEIVDVSPSYISEIERGSSIASLATICKIVNALECSLDYIVFGITPDNIDHTFSELIKDIPKKYEDLYIDLCTNIANSLK